MRSHRKYSEIEKKARRRIKRQLATGKKQHRVRQQDEKTFVYLIAHAGESMKFRLDKLNRLRKIAG